MNNLLTLIRISLLQLTEIIYCGFEKKKKTFFYQLNKQTLYKDWEFTALNYDLE